MGGAKYKPNDKDRQTVEQMSAVGIPQESIANVLKLSVDTITRHYKDELTTAASKANTKVAGMLYNKAIRGDTACMIFWLKTRAGWREVNHHEVTGANGAPFVPVLNISIKKK